MQQGSFFLTSSYIMNTFLHMDLIICSSHYQYGQNPVWPTHSCIISWLILNYRSIIELDDQALNGKWQISLPVVQDMLTLIAIRIICLSHGSSFASLNNKLMFLCICQVLSVVLNICYYCLQKYQTCTYILHD